MPCGSSKGNTNHDQNNHCAFEDLDHSVLQQPLNLGVTNVKQILRCIQSGSKEVKDIILNECNIIYECKVCDGLFRSLANFLYHKRCYCKKHLCEDMLLFENFDDEIITVNPEPPLESKHTAENFPGIRLTDCTVNLENMEFKSIKQSSNPESSKRKNGSSSQDVETEDRTESTMISRRTRNKNAQTAIKVISTEEPPIKCTNMISARIIRKDPNEKRNAEEKKGGKDGKTKKITITKFPDSKKTRESPFPKVIFKAIDSNPHAVYQDSIKKKAGSISSGTKAKSDKDKVLIVMKKDAKDGSPKAKSPGIIKKFEKISEFSLTRRKRLLARKDCDVNELRCLTCKTQFLSLRTLYFHMLSLHSKKRLYYPCPFCDTLFVQTYGVSRHLMTIHHKSKEQISKLREIIKKKSIWKKIEDVQPGFIAFDQEIKPMVKEVKKEQKSTPSENTPETVEDAVYSEIADSATIVSATKTTTDSMSVEDSPHPKPVEITTHSKPVEIATISKPVEIATKSKPMVEKQPISDLFSKQSDKNTILHACGKCGRLFGRKSSQVSHEKFCIMNTLIKKENVDDPPAVLPSPTITSPVLSFVAKPQKQAPTTPVKHETATFQKQSTPAPQKAAIPSPQKPATLTVQKQATPTYQKQSTQAPRKQATPKATCVLHISAPGATPVSKPTKSENNPVNKPAVEMPANMFNLKLSTRPKRGAEKQMHKDFVNSQTLKWRSANRVDTSASSKAHVPVKKVSGKNLEKTVLGFINSEDLTCLKCKKKFSSYSNLRRHVAIHVGWTRFKCRYCDYQAYNKSQCWSHVQKSHEVEDEEVEKYIVYLTNCGPRKKGKQSFDVSEDYCIRTSKRKIGYNPKNGSTKKQKQIKNESDLKQDEAESGLEDPDIKTAATSSKVSKKSLQEEEKDKAKATITLAKVAHKDGLDSKKKLQTTITIHKIPIQEAGSGRNDKKEYVIPLQQAQSPEKKEGSYKTLTTSKPTTIILSKTIPSKAVQPVTAESAVKTSPTRTSQRKPEAKIAEEKITASTAPRSLENIKVTPLKIQVRSNSSNEAAQESGASSCPKKQKLVSEWFPKKEGRRDSAPLIIGLVPASSSQAKNSTEAPEDEK